MKKQTYYIFVAMVAILAACGTEKPAAIGEWNFGDRNIGKGHRWVGKLNIQQDSITSISVVHLAEGGTVKAEARARAEVTSNKIRILEDKKEEVKERGVICNATVERGELDYEVKNNQLILRKGTATLTLTR